MYPRVSNTLGFRVKIYAKLHDLIGCVEPRIKSLGRTRLAHQHIGYQLLTDRYTKRAMNKYIAKAFDYFVVFPARQHHNDEFREHYYGEYGNYRDCPAYGVECRSLGGFFTQDKYLSWVYNQTVKTIEYCSLESNLTKLDKVDAPVTKDVESTLEHYKTLEINLNDQLIKE